MRVLDWIIYSTIGFAAFIKCFAISINEYQIIGTYLIVLLSFILIISDLQGIIKHSISRIIFALYFSYFLSSLYIFTSLKLAVFLDSLLFPSLFLSSFVFFKRYPKAFDYLKYVGIVSIILAYFNLLRLSNEININSNNPLQSNAGNTLVAFLPFVLLWKQKIIKYPLILLIFIGCMISLKRSAFIIFIGIILMYFTLKRNKPILKTIIPSVGIILIILLFILPHIDMAGPLLERLSNTSEDGGSGRDKLVLLGINLLRDNNLYEWILGNGYKGFSADLAKQGLYFTCAHNDFVEILYDAGIISFIIFLILLYKLIKFDIKLYRYKNGNTIIMSSILITFFGANLFVCSFVHYWYYLPLFCLFGATYSLTRIVDEK